MEVEAAIGSRACCMEHRSSLDPDYGGSEEAEEAGVEHVGNIVDADDDM